jgi:hypothetical protein
MISMRLRHHHVLKSSLNSNMNRLSIRNYDSLRQSSMRIIKKTSNKDMSNANKIAEYAKARGEKLSSFIDQQRSQQNAGQSEVFDGVGFIAEGLID